MKPCKTCWISGKDFGCMDCSLCNVRGPYKHLFDSSVYNVTQLLAAYDMYHHMSDHMPASLRFDATIIGAHDHHGRLTLQHRSDYDVFPRSKQPEPIAYTCQGLMGRLKWGTAIPAEPCQNIHLPNRGHAGDPAC